MHQQLQTNIAISIDTISKISNVINNSFSYNSVPTGVEALDQLITGIAEQQVIVVSGRTGSRKTMLAINMFLNYVQKGFKSVFFNMELPAQEFNSRVKSVAENRNIKLETLNENNLTIINAVHDINTLVELVKQLHAMGKPIKYLFIDYIGFMINPYSKTKWMEEIIIIRKLKELTTKYNMSVILLTQLNKDYHGRSRPDETAIAGSDEISRIADKIIIVYNWSKANPLKATEFTHKFTEIIVPKNRQGDGYIGIRVVFNDFSYVDNQTTAQYFLALNIKLGA